MTHARFMFWIGAFGGFSLGIAIGFMAAIK